MLKTKLKGILLLSMLSFGLEASTVVTKNGYTIGMPIPPNNYALSWDQQGSIQMEQNICLIGYKSKLSHSCKDDDDDRSRNYNTFTDRDDDDDCDDDDDDRYDYDTYHYNYSKTPIDVQLRAFGLNSFQSGRKFTMRNRNNDFIKYQIHFLNHHNSQYVRLKQNVWKNGIRGVRDCDQQVSTNQKVKISVDFNSLQNAPSGRYWDLVTLSTAINEHTYTYDLFYVWIDIEGGRLQINQLDDINFGMYKVGQGDLILEEQFCIHESPSNSYNINIYDTHPNSGEWKFNIDSGHQAIPYRVYFKTTSTNYYPVYNGSTMGSFRANSEINCTNTEFSGDGERAYIKIEIAEKDLIKAKPEFYKGTLHFTVSPE